MHESRARRNPNEKHRLQNRATILRHDSPRNLLHPIYPTPSRPLGPRLHCKGVIKALEADVLKPLEAAVASGEGEVPSRTAVSQQRPGRHDVE